MAPWIRRNIPDDLFQELEGLVCGVSGGADTDPMDIVVGNVSQDLNMTFGVRPSWLLARQRLTELYTMPATSITYP